VEDAAGLKLFLILSLATLGQNSMEYKTKGSKNSQFIVKITRNFHYGPISQKCHTEYFLIYQFGKPLGCPATSQQWFTRTTKFGKLALKKGCA
jgi:hypothetical protein